MQDARAACTSGSTRKGCKAGRSPAPSSRLPLRAYVAKLHVARLDRHGRQGRRVPNQDLKRVLFLVLDEGESLGCSHRAEGVQGKGVEGADTEHKLLKWVGQHVPGDREEGVVRLSVMIAAGKGRFLKGQSHGRMVSAFWQMLDPRRGIVPSVV